MKKEQDKNIKELTRFIKEKNIDKDTIRSFKNLLDDYKKLKEKENPELKTIIHITRQSIFAKCIQWRFCTLGNDLYYFNQALNILRADVGEKALKGLAKENKALSYKDVSDNLEFFSRKVAELKFYYDRKEEFKDLASSKKYEEALEEVSNANMLIFVFKCFFALIEKSKIKFLSIPHDMEEVFEDETKYEEEGYLKKKED